MAGFSFFRATAMTRRSDAQGTSDIYPRRLSVYLYLLSLERTHSFLHSLTHPRTQTHSPSVCVRLYKKT